MSLHYRGVSFEILNPHKSLCRSKISSPEEAQRCSLDYFDEMSSDNSNKMERNSGAENPPSLQPEDQQRKPSLPRSVIDELLASPRRSEFQQDHASSSHSFLDNSPAPALHPEDEQRRPSLPRSMFDDPGASSPHQSEDRQGQAMSSLPPFDNTPAPTLQPEDEQRRPSLPRSVLDDLLASTSQNEQRQFSASGSLFDDLPAPAFQSEEQQRRPTPPRALFEDLPTAYTSITSRPPPLTSSPDYKNTENPFGRLPPCAEFPPTASQAISSGSLADQPGQIPYSVPFSSLEDGPPPVMVGPGHEPLTVTSPGFRSSKSSKELARSLTRRVSKFMSMNGLANKKTSLVFPARAGPEREPSTRSNRLTKGRPFSNLVRNKAARDSLTSQNARSSLTQDLNWRQPNFQSARGRIDKPNKIDEIVRKRYSGTGSKRNSLRQSINRPGSRLSTDFRYVNTSEVFDCHDGGSSSKETCVGAPQTQIGSGAGEVPDVPLPSPPRVGARFQGSRLHSVQSVLSSDVSYGNSSNLLQLPPGSSPSKVNRHSAIETVEEEPADQGDQSPKLMIATSGHETNGNAHPSPLASNPVFRDQNPYNNQMYANSIDMFNPYHDFSGELEASSSRIEPVYDQGEPSLLAGGVQDPTSSSLGAPEIDDLGPGGYQSSSSQNLSQQETSFWNLKPRLGLKGLKANNPFLKHRNSNTSTVDPNTQRVSISESVDRDGGQMKTSGGRVEVENDEEDDDAADWETVGAESQIFPGEPEYVFGQTDTGSSLANYSSYGSFMPENRFNPLNSQTDQFSRDSTPFNPARRGLAHSHRVHQESRNSRSGLPTDCRFPTIEEDVSVSNHNVLAPPAPTLSATTRNGPDPLLRGSLYKHPNPLDDPHRNPFQSTPPEIPQGYKAAKMKTQGYPETGIVNNNSELSEYQNPKDYEGSQNRDQVLRENDELVSSATAPRDITSFSSSAWITEFTSPTGPALSPSTFPHTSQFQNKTYLNTPHVVTGRSQADDNNSENFSLRSYIKTPGQPCPARASDSSPTPMPPNQPMVREVSNLASAAMSTSSTDRLLPATSVAEPSPGSLSKTFRTARERFRASRSKGNRLEEVVDEEEGRASRSCAGSARVPTAFPQPPPPTAKTSRLVRHKTPHRDDLVRERLRRMESTVLADYLPSASSRTGSRLAFPTSARTVGGGFPTQGSALSTVGDVEDPWFSVEEGHYVFSDPPRLLPVPDRRQSEPVSTIVVQGRLGRKLVWRSFLLPVLGLGVLLCIGMGVEASDRLMTWWSGGVVEEFHAKERALARRLVAAQGGILMTIIIVSVVVSLKL